MHACSVRTPSRPKSTNSQRKVCAKRGIFWRDWSLRERLSGKSQRFPLRVGGAVGRNGFIANAHIIIKCIAVERENYTFPARRRGVGGGRELGKTKRRGRKCGDATIMRWYHNHNDENLRPFWIMNSLSTDRCIMREGLIPGIWPYAIIFFCS